MTAGTNHSIREPEGKTFDWFKTYDQISNHIAELIPDKSARILMLGCGNSKLSEEVLMLFLLIKSTSDLHY